MDGPRRAVALRLQPRRRGRRRVEPPLGRDDRSRDRGGKTSAALVLLAILLLITAPATEPGDDAGGDAPTEEPGGVDLVEFGGLLVALLLAVFGLALFRRMPRS